MDMRVEATTMSMSIKGIYSRKPRVNACFSSLVTKAGIITISGSSTASSSVAGRGSPAIPQYSSRLCGSVQLLINRLNGACARWKNSCWVISSA